MKITTDIADFEYEELLKRIESLEKTTKDINIGGDISMGNVHAKGLISGTFRSGDGIKDVDLTGFQMDGEELVGQVAGVDQVVLDADTGKLTAGAGDVALDVDGITFAAVLDDAPSQDKLKWAEGGHTFAVIYSYYTGTSPNRNAYSIVRSYGEGTGEGYLQLQGGSYYLILNAIDGLCQLAAPHFQLSTAQAPIRFGDSNTEIWESAGSDLSFKDANAGTLTLKQLYGQKIVMGAPTELTIAGGAITVTQSNHIVDTEGGAATDDLDTINGGVDGQLLFLGSASTAREPTLKHGTGNLNLTGTADIVLNNVRKIVQLLCVGDEWRKVDV